MRRLLWATIVILAGIAASTRSEAADKKFILKTSPYLLVRPAFDSSFKAGLGLDIETILGNRGTFGFYFQFLSRNILGVDRTDALFGFHTNAYLAGDTIGGGLILRPKAGFGFPSTGGFYGHIGAGALVQVISSGGVVLELGAQVMTRPLYLSGSAEGRDEVQVDFLTGLGFTF